MPLCPECRGEPIPTGGGDFDECQTCDGSGNATEEQAAAFRQRVAKIDAFCDAEANRRFLNGI